MDKPSRTVPLTLLLAMSTLMAAAPSLSCCHQKRPTVQHPTNPTELLANFRQKFQARITPQETPALFAARSLVQSFAKAPPPGVKLADLGCHGRFCAVELVYPSPAALRQHIAAQGSPFLAYRQWSGAKFMTTFSPPQSVRSKGPNDPVTVVVAAAPSPPPPTAQAAAAAAPADPCDWGSYLDPTQNSDIFVRRSYHMSAADCRGYLSIAPDFLSETLSINSAPPDVDPHGPGDTAISNPSIVASTEGSPPPRTLVCPVPYMMDNPWAPSKICVTAAFRTDNSNPPPAPFTCRTRAIGMVGSRVFGLLTLERFTAQQAVPRGNDTVSMSPIVDTFDEEIQQNFAVDPGSALTETFAFELECDGLTATDALYRYRYDFQMEDYWGYGK